MKIQKTTSTKVTAKKCFIDEKDNMIHDGDDNIVNLDSLINELFANEVFDISISTKTEEDVNKEDE